MSPLCNELEDGPWESYWATSATHPRWRERCGIQAFGAAVHGAYGGCVGTIVGGDVQTRLRQLRELAQKAREDDERFSARMKSFFDAKGEAAKEEAEPFYRECLERGLFKQAERVKKILVKGGLLTKERSDFLMAEAYFDVGAHEQAEGLFRKLAKNDEMRFPANFYVARTLYYRAHWDQAITVLDLMAQDKRYSDGERDEVRVLREKVVLSQKSGEW